MSMLGGTGRTPQNVGETVARYGDYEAAQKAVSKLIEAEVPAREISIVWAGLKAVEMVTGRMGYARAAWSGALNGAFLGLMFGAIFTLLSPTLSIQVLLGCLLVGVAIGMMMQILTYSLTRRRRDYTSITAPIAEHYEIAVSGPHVSSARDVLGGGDRPGRVAPSARAAAPTPPAPLEPPRYGIRIDDRPASAPQAPTIPPVPPLPPQAAPVPPAPGDAPQAEPAEPRADEPRSDEPHSDEPRADESESEGPTGRDADRA
ncbi:hypothetical protein GCM10027064_17800 [Microbacterium petrolearium]